MKRIIEQIAKNIRERRVASGLSQRELAKRAKKTDRYISMIETENIKDLRLSNLNDIADALDCTIGDLIASPTSGPAPKNLTRRNQFSISREAAIGLEVAIKILNQAHRQSKK